MAGGSLIPRAFAGIGQPGYRLLRALVLAVAYFAVARLSRGLVAEPEEIAVLWPAAGLLVAGLLLSERRDWAELAVGVLFAATAANLASGFELAVAAGFGFASVLEGLLTAYLFPRLVGRRLAIFEDPAASLRFLLLVVLAGVLLGSALGALVSDLGLDHSYWDAFYQWALAGLLGITFVAPLLLALGAQRAAAAARSPLLPTALVALALATLTALCFLPEDGSGIPFLDSAYPILALIGLAALRLPRLPVSSMLLALSIVAAVLTLDGRGPFSDAGIGDLVDSVLALQAFLLVTVAGALTILAITAARRKTNAALTESEARYRGLAENLPLGGVCVLSPDGRCTLATGRLFGSGTPGNAKGLLVATPLKGGEHGLSNVYEAGRRALLRGLRFEGEATAATGEPLHVQVAPTRGGAGPRSAICVLEDISERRRQELAAHEAAERFRSLFERSGIGTVVVSYDDDEGGRLLDVNDAFCELVGMAREELLEGTIEQLTHPDDQPAIRMAIRRLARGEVEVLELDKRVVRADGTSIPVQATSSFVRDAAGRPLYRIAQMRDVTDERAFEEKLRTLADRDHLTGFFNRRRFEEELDRQVAASRRYRVPTAVLLLDIDNFKRFNDSLGHMAGDELIKRVATVLDRRVRRSDVLGRIGGDEFAVILPHTHKSGAEVVARDLLEALRSEGAVALGRSGFRLSATIGIAHTDDGAQSGDRLLVESDTAMYDAKEEGRGGWKLYDPESPKRALERDQMGVAERIERALAGDRFVLHAQPIVALEGPPGERRELLIRMLDDDDELLPPAAFLPAAERLGLIGAIDRWVVYRAIEILGASNRRGERWAFAVNLSAQSLGDRELVDLVADLLAAHGVHGSQLTFEITETAAIGSIEKARELSAMLRSLGCGFALDDFGSGFASFYYLKHLDFDVVKIDGEFIRNLASSELDQHVVRTLATMARGLGKQTVAEFVGDAEAVGLLRAYGVDYAQGFYLGRPEPIELERPVVEPGGRARVRAP